MILKTIEITSGLVLQVFEATMNFASTLSS